MSTIVPVVVERVTAAIAEIDPEKLNDREVIAYLAGISETASGMLALKPDLKAHADLVMDLANRAFYAAKDAEARGYARAAADLAPNSPAAAVAEFHALIGSPTWAGPIDQMPAATLAVRNRLIREEVQELVDATDAGDVVGIADGLADLVYVAYGTAFTYGIDLDAVLAEVHRSNMTKEPGPTGKAVKGPGYQRPDIAGVLNRDQENDRG